MRPIRAVVFDLFDTLVDLRIETLPRVEQKGRVLSPSLRRLHETAKAHAEVEEELSFDDFAKLLAEVDRHFFESRYREHREVPTIERFSTIAERLGASGSTLAERLTEVHMGILHSAVEVPGHHAELLAALATRAKIGLCSNFSHTPTAMRVLEEGGMAAHFSALVISEGVGTRKPHRDIFDAVLGELGVEPDETLHVGDSLSADVGGAGELGIRTAWVTRRVKDPGASLARWEGPKPDWQIADLEELRDLV